MFKTLFATGALAAACCLPASAITLVGSTTQGATVVTSFSGPSLVSFDIDFANLAPAVLSFRVDAGDTAPIALDAMLRNFTGGGLSGYGFTLSGGSFASIGSVTRQFGGTASVNASGPAANITFSSLEFLDVEIGDALGTTPGANDWTLGGLAAGNVFQLTVTPVPEPGTYALLLAGLATLGFIAQRRRG
jgi:hypothetical protein